MNNPKQPTSLRAEIYHALEEVLMQSAQGRGFLTEYARRNRTADTQLVLDAIGRLEVALHQPRTSADLIRRDLIEMSEAISRTRAEIAAIRPPRGSHEGGGVVVAAEELDSIALATERATSDILAATESMQEALWRLRECEQEHKPLQGICDALESRLTDIIAACSFQDITGQRIAKVVQAMRLIESRVNSMIEIWGLDDYEIEAVPASPVDPDSLLLNGPPGEGEGLTQSDVDSMIGDVAACDTIEAGEMDIEAVDAPIAEPPAPASDEDDLFGPEPARHGVEREPQVAPERTGYPGHVESPLGDLLPNLQIETLDPVKRSALFN